LVAEHQIWIKNSANKYRYSSLQFDNFRTYSKEDFDAYTQSPNLKIKNTYHFLIVGLDRFTYTIRELYQELVNRLGTMVGRVKAQNIMIIDNESLLSKLSDYHLKF
jgi:hypothetical protein